MSAGTEEAVIKLAKKNLVGKARERPDLAKKVFEKAKNDGLVPTYRAVMGRLESPSPLGYSCCGRVIEVGENVESFSEGDMVACGGAGYANHAEVVYVPENLATPLPDGVHPEDGAFATIGAIAMQGVRRADISPGENVAVIGLGLIGLLTTQILNAYGSPVLGIDIDPTQVKKGLDCGLDQGVTIDDGVEQTAQSFSDGHGVDAVIITASTDSDQPIEMAGEIVREQGRISAVGQVGMDVPRNLYYEKELDLRISRSYGPGRYDQTYEEKGLSYPIEYVRWTENRNMKEFLRLIADGRISLDSIRTHSFDFSEALDAYDLILDNPNDEDFTGVLLEYDTDIPHSQKVSLGSTRQKQQVEGSVVRAGLIGGGNFARTTILPALSDISSVELRAVATATGKTASSIGKDHSCEYVTTDYHDLLDDPEIDLVVIATRNHLHAEMAEDALNQGKHVFVEKPLALTESELHDVLSAEQQSDGRLMVGFNRRFSHLSEELKAELGDQQSPVMINYRVNAESVPGDHWIHDIEQGGGRIRSEVCHFIDFAQFVTGSPPSRVYASGLSPDGNITAHENANIIVDFEDGSSAVVQYTAIGDSSLPKERIEVFGAGKSQLINNFKHGLFGARQDKGHTTEYRAFIDTIRDGSPNPISIEEIASSSLATLRIHNSMSKNQPISVDLGSLGE
ncbi:bi-domain-containing oxidoreductase [Halorubrum miltondacostae]|uniref:Bi-domain-containing oxidoreductase n=1 Tax=Halorubrum miltondacostae TaxID=3076378 RepID=A0ABD5M9H3_9EURY